MDEREDVAMVAAQQFPQVRAAGSMAHVRIAHRAARGERLGDLVVQFHAVRDDHERPVAFHLAQNLLREEHHRQALAAPLRLPEHAAATMPRLARLEHIAARALFTPRNWWFCAMIFTSPALCSENS